MIAKRVIVMCLLVCVPALAFSGGATESGAVAESEPSSTPWFVGYFTDVDSENAWRVEERDGSFHLIDGEGTIVPIRTYERIVITSAGAVEILYGLGSEDHIAAIGTSRSGIWPKEKTSKLPSVGGLARPSFEQIVAFEPDLVIANGMNTEIAVDLNKLGIPTIIHSTDTIAEILNAVLILGALTGAEEKAIDTVKERTEALESVRAQLEKTPLHVKGAFIYSVDPIMAFRDDSLPGEVLSILGVENIAAGLTTERPILNPEYILEQNPDFLLGAMSIRTPDQILNADTVIRKTRAGRENNIVIVPSFMILRPTPRVIDALVMLRDELVKLAEATQ